MYQKEGFQVVLNTKYAHGMSYKGNIIKDSADIACILAYDFKTLCLFGEQILDPKSETIRISYEDKKTLHEGMQKINDFTSKLSICKDKR